MKKILIFEGVATSGKSTIEAELGKICENSGLSFVLYHEDETVIPLLGDKSIESSITLLDQILEKLRTDTHDVVAIDRFYLTHLERTGAALGVYKGIADELTSLGARIICLKLDEEKIRERLEDAMARRSKKFADYINERGGVEAAIPKYIKQQSKLLDLLSQSGIPFSVYDTSEMQLDSVAREIAEEQLGPLLPGVGREAKKVS